MFENPNTIPQEDNQTKEYSRETERRPEKLYRGFAINPEELTIEKLKSVMKPGTISEDDPTKILDGNELGVYMSTNPSVAEIYASSGRFNYLKTPEFIGKRGLERGVLLPNCGIVIEINTKDIEIRRPEIAKYLKGVYNNNFEGEEWIADSIEPQNYKIQKLMLSRYANDGNKIIVEINDESEESLQEAINSIKAQYQEIKEAAEEYKRFLEELSPEERLSQFELERKWGKRSKNE